LTHQKVRQTILFTNSTIGQVAWYKDNMADLPDAADEVEFRRRLSLLQQRFSSFGETRDACENAWEAMRPENYDTRTKWITDVMHLGEQLGKLPAVVVEKIKRTAPTDIWPIIRGMDALQDLRRFMQEYDARTKSTPASTTDSRNQVSMGRCQSTGGQTRKKNC